MGLNFQSMGKPLDDRIMKKRLGPMPRMEMEDHIRKGRSILMPCDNAADIRTEIASLPSEVELSRGDPERMKRALAQIEAKKANIANEEAELRGALETAGIHPDEKAKKRGRPKVGAYPIESPSSPGVHALDSGDDEI